jgi:hypothetical protein
MFTACAYSSVRVCLPVSFGKTAKRYRKAVPSLTQEEVCKELNKRLPRASFVQSTISAWEIDRQLPADEETVRAYADIIKWPKWDALQVWNDQRRSSDVGRFGLSTEQYFRQASHFLESIEHSADLWFIGPDQLPAMRKGTDSAIRENWVENISKGVVYNALWILEYVTEHSLTRLVQIMCALNSDLKRCAEGNDRGNFGSFHNFACFEFPHSRTGDSASVSKEKIFRSLEEASQKGGACFYSFKYCDLHFSQNTQKRLERYAQAFGTILVYLPRNPTAPGAASIALQNVRTSLREPEEQVFHWFGEHDTIELSSIANQIKLELDKNESK